MYKRQTHSNSSFDEVGVLKSSPPIELVTNAVQGFEPSPANIASPHLSSNGSPVVQNMSIGSGVVGSLDPNSSSNFGADWQTGLEAQAMSLLVAGHQDVWDILSKRFESTLIQTALANTRGRRIEAAQKLGIGRNTITRKIQELGLE